MVGWTWRNIFVLNCTEFCLDQYHLTSPYHAYPAFLKVMELHSLIESGYFFTFILS